MSALATLAITAVLLALTARVGCRRRDYGADPIELPVYHERPRRRGGRVFFGCWRIA